MAEHAPPPPAPGPDVEPAVARQLARLERAEAAAQLGSWEHDLTTGAVWWSAQMQVLAGSRPGEGPVPDLRHLHPDDRAAAAHTLRRAIATGQPQQVTVRSNPKRGPQRWLRATGQCEFDAQGRALRVSGTLLDITARQQAEQALQALNNALEQRIAERTRQLSDSERRHRSIFEAVPVAILENDWSDTLPLLLPLRGLAPGAARAHFAAHPALVAACLQASRVLRMNPAARALFELPAPADAFTTLAQVFDRSDSSAPFVDQMLALLAGARGHSHQRSLRRSDGSTAALLVTLAFAAPDEPPGTVLVSLVDITELQRLSAALDASLQRVTRINQELETFTYSVSHDLKAPLRGLDGYSQLLLRQQASRLDDEGRLFVAHIRTAARQMGQLIDDLLAYSKLERRQPALVAVPLRPLLGSILAGFAAELGQLGIGVDLCIDPHLDPDPDIDIDSDIDPGIDRPAPGPGALAVTADAQSLTLALRNLIDNAIKFSRHTPHAQIAVGADHTHTGVVIWVRDNGMGFDMRFHDRIFDIFQRLHRAEDHPGTGIGLAIVRKAMERMGGAVWADSRPGQGATFYLQLPRA